PIPLTQFTSVDSLNAWEQHYTVLIDSVEAGLTQYIDDFVPLTGENYYYWVQAVGSAGVSKIAPTSIGTIVAGTLSEFQVNAPYPNPFNPAVTIEFTIPKECRVTLVMYDILGREVAVLHNRVFSAGTYQAVWDGRDFNGVKVSSGVYLYKFIAGVYTAHGKLMFLR
ncbi:MAG TPA: T9SS type A sorting domain-containing protein, partial [bacterium]|nr:T9SS type A sorting domain-containing protein [bacterium]